MEQVHCVHNLRQVERSSMQLVRLCATSRLCECEEGSMSSEQLCPACRTAEGPAFDVTPIHAIEACRMEHESSMPGTLCALWSAPPGWAAPQC